MLVAEHHSPYPGACPDHSADPPAATSPAEPGQRRGGFLDPLSWRDGLISLCGRLEPAQRSSVGAIAIAGTSGTLLLCQPDGSPLNGELALALPYWQACPEQARAATDLVAPAADLAGGGGHLAAASASGSLARALRLLARTGAGDGTSNLLLRHQADWLMGWLLGHWRWGEEGNNLRLGWDLQHQAWAGSLADQPWAAALPQIRASGAVLGPLASPVAALLGLPPDCQVVGGSTDANGAVLAAAPGPTDGITVLGTTLVLKQFVDEPIRAAGVSCHRVAGRWLVGGAANAGAGVLRRFYSDQQIRELSRQIDPDRDSGLRLRPMAAVGERFPVDDPHLPPVLEPRPSSDALYLQALLEGLTRIEVAGWQRLQQLGAPPVERLITLGGGAQNPQWRLLRERMLQRPVLNRPGLGAALGMGLLASDALAAANHNGGLPPATTP